MNIKRLCELIWHFFFPVSCEKCGRPGKILCDECKAQEAREKRIEKLIDRAIERAIPEIVSRVLEELGKQQPAPEQQAIATNITEDDYIASMFEAKPIMRQIDSLIIYSAAIYYSQIKILIHDFKYSGKKSLCAPLGRAMAKFFPKPEADCIVPVPLHLSSTRNYNQAAELAANMAEIWGLPVLEAAQWSRDMSNRVGLSGRERKQLTHDAFRITQDVRRKFIVLVDDVCTTGATLSCLARALSDAGAVIVCAYSLAGVSV